MGKKDDSGSIPTKVLNSIIGFLVLLLLTVIGWNVTQISSNIQKNQADISSLLKLTQEAHPELARIWYALSAPELGTPLSQAELANAYRVLSAKFPWPGEYESQEVSQALVEEGGLTVTMSNEIADNFVVWGDDSREPEGVLIWNPEREEFMDTGPLTSERLKQAPLEDERLFSFSPTSVQWVLLAALAAMLLLVFWLKE